MSMQLQTQVKIYSTPTPSFTPAQIGLQRKCVSNECEERRKKKLTLQRSPTNQNEPSKVPPIVHEVLRSPGQPLDTETRAFMESRFGHDFSKVRVHTDEKAAESARAVNALAYTVGKDVVFGNGQYSPLIHEGRKLIAHELIHVMQQRGMHGSEIHIGSQEDPAEYEAHDAAECILQANFPSTSVVAPWAYNMAQRQVSEEEGEEGEVEEEGEEEDKDERHRISVITDSHIPILQRQNRDIPPPPPDFPHFTQIYFGDVFDKIGELEMTCDDRLERGFWIFFNESTKKPYPGDIVVGDPGPKDCSRPAEIDLGPMPRDRGNILVAGWFHNHPPMWPRCRQIEVGPSVRDRRTSSELKLPGLVQDFKRPGPNTTCKGNPRATFFFGPPRREI